MFAENYFITNKNFTIMAAFEFEFNQSELEQVINNSIPANDLHIAVFSHHDRGKPVGEIYLAAQSCNQNGDPDTSLRPAVGCPVPPGWRAGSAFISITHEELVNCPKFIVPTGIKATLLNNNFPPPPATDKLLRVILEGSIPAGDLVIKASFKIKDNAGNITSTVDAEVK
jgi:hypothetical protein